LTVTLFTTDPDEATTPQTVVIAAGQSSASFTVSGVQDFQSDGSRLTRVVAAAPFMRFGSQSLLVTDSASSFAASYVLHGDQNTVRNQGHLQIVNNTISNSLNYGIVVQPNPNPGANPGAVINLPTLDTNRQVPGVDIVSNIIYNFGTGGILFQGSASSSAEVPFGRIVNNTIYGGDTPQGTRVTVQNNAAPTLINHILA